MTPSQSILLKALQAANGDWLTVDQIVDLLWPSGRAPDTADKIVHIYIHKLRKQLGHGAIETRRPAYRMKGAA
jgi:DNA-binding SARP family transcriptional activator